MSISIKLAPKLFDLLQHCELRCNASCCGWDAFDFSDHWVSQWCKSRDASVVAAAREDIARIEELIDHCNSNDAVIIERFFQATAGVTNKRLAEIDQILTCHLLAD